MRNKYTVIIGISAYNEEANIGNLLKEIQSQAFQNCTLKNVLIVSDGSIDQTVNVASRFSHDDHRIKVIDRHDRKGKALRMNEIIDMSDSDILILLDADICLKDARFIEKMVNSIASGADLTSATQKALPPENFFEKILYASTKLKERIYNHYNSRNNIYSCQGHSRAFSKRLYKEIRFMERVGEDAYSYLFCITEGFKFASAKDVCAYYKLPTNFRDHQKQSVRFFRSTKAYEDIFGKQFVSACYKIPWKITLGSIFLTLLEYPLHLSIYFLIMIFMKIKAIFTDVSPTWEMSVSTKRSGKNI